MKLLHNEHTQDKVCCFIMAAGLSVEILWQHIRTIPSEPAMNFSCRKWRRTGYADSAVPQARYHFCLHLLICHPVS